jgi:hypothetical protein
MMTFAYEDDGFCRVVFHRHVDGAKYTYCWQQARTDEFEFYRCTSDGEPSHIVLGWGGVPAHKLTPRNPSHTPTGGMLNAYLAKMNGTEDAPGNVERL